MGVDASTNTGIDIGWYGLRAHTLHTYLPRYLQMNRRKINIVAYMAVSRYSAFFFPVSYQTLIEYMHVT